VVQVETPAGTRQAGSGGITSVAGVSRALVLIGIAWASVVHAEFDPSQATPTAVVYGRDQGISFGALRGVAVDARAREIFIADAGRHEIVAVDTLGRALGWFIHQVPDARGRLIDGTPTWLAVDREGYLLVSDERAPWVDVMDFRGRSVARLDCPAEVDPRGLQAGAIAVAPDGVIYVASRGDSGRVHRFGPGYEYQGSWGVAGTDSGHVGGITGMAVGADGLVFVSSGLARLAVQVFDADGRFLGGFGLHDLGEGNFSMPAGVAATADGRVWVTDEIRQVVNVFSPAGSYMGMFGGMGTAPGSFRYPSALASDGGGLLVVAERVGNRVQVWRTR